MKYELMILAGRGIWVDILPRSNSLTWGSDNSTLGADLSFTSIVDFTEGTHVAFKIDDEKSFIGIVVKKTRHKLNFSYTCFDYAWYLNKNKVSVIQFNKIPASQAIEQLCSKFGVKVSCVTIDFVVQDEKKTTVKSKVDKTITLKSGETKVAKRVVSTKITTLVNKIYKDMTLSAIIDDILEQATLELGTKYIKEMIGDILYIRKQLECKIFPKFIVNNDLAVNSSIENMKNKVQVVSSDEKNNKILVSISDANSVKTYGGLQEVISIEEKDISKAKNTASNYLKENNKIFRDTSLNIIVLKGGEEIRANRSIGLSLISMGLDGWYNIKSTSCSLENSQMKVNITLEW